MAIFHKGTLMTLKQFFESRLKLDDVCSYTVEGIRGYLAQELANQHTGYDILRATVAADEFIVGLLRTEAAAILIRSIR